MKLTAIAMLLASTVSVAAQQVTSFPPANLPLSGSETVYLVQGGNGRQTTVGNIGAAGGAGVYLPLAGNATVTGATTFSGGVIGNLTGTASGNLPLTGGTVSGATTFSGGLNGTLTGHATSDLPLTGGTVSGATTFTSGVTIGQNASGTGGVFINGAATSSRMVQWQTAGADQWQLFTAANTQALTLIGITNASVSNTYLTIDNNTGSEVYTWPTITYSGSDSGTPGVSQPINATERLAGVSTSTTGLVSNSFTVSDLGSASGGQDIYMANQFFYAGGTNPTFGKIGTLDFLHVNGPILANTGGTGGNFVTHTFFANATGDGGASATSLGAALSAANFSVDFPVGTTNWGIAEISQYNMYVAPGNNLWQRTIMAVGIATDNGTQGGQNDAPFSVAWNPLTTSGGGATIPPFSGAQWRVAYQLGCGCGAYWPLDPINGEIVSTSPAIARYNANSTFYGAPPQAAWRGDDYAAVNFSDAAFSSPGAKIYGSGSALFAGLGVSAGGSGPVIDATAEFGVVASIANAGSNYYAGEQFPDRLGGILSIDTVSGTAVATAHYLRPPWAVPGVVVQVGSGINDVAATTGATVLSLRQGTRDMAIGDTVTDAGTAGAIGSGVTVTAIDLLSDKVHTKITISGSGLIANLPSGEMLTFNQTMPPSTIRFPPNLEGANGLVLNVTWTAPAQIGIATNSGLPTAFGGVVGQPLTTWTDTQPCTAGQVTWDASFLYVCTATNTVKRVTLATF